jgi:hypothetical protein
MLPSWTSEMFAAHLQVFVIQCHDPDHAEHQQARLCVQCREAGTIAASMGMSLSDLWFGLKLHVDVRGPLRRNLLALHSQGLTYTDAVKRMRAELDVRAPLQSACA